MSRFQNIIKEFNINHKLLKQLIKPPKRTPKYHSFNNKRVVFNQEHQIDLLYLPNDQGYKYLLVVVDMATRYIDAQPLKKRDGPTILKGLKQIYSRKILNQPRQIDIDSGSEFSDIKKYCLINKIYCRISTVNRHSQQAVVEAYNGIIGKVIMTIQNNEEISSGIQNTEWVDYLPTIINKINELHIKEKPYRIPIGDPICDKKNGDCNILEEKTKVRIALDYPKDIYNNRLHSKWRNGDIRWSLKPYIIEKILLYPETPIRYIVKNIESGEIPLNSFPKNQLMIYEETKTKPIVEKWEVEKLLRRFKKNNKIYFKVKWTTGEITDEPRTNLIKDIKEMIEEYENKLKK